MTHHNLSGSADFILVNSGAYFSEQSMVAGQTEPSTHVIDMYDLPDYDLSVHKFAVIDSYIDQELMMKQSKQIRQFLDQGNILLFSGHLFRPWLPGGSLFQPKTIRDHRDYTVCFPQQHPIFEGVTSEDLTYNRGVSGFFARGHHPLPPHAEVLLTLSGVEPITYIDRHSTKGTLLVHAGSNLLRYSNPANTSGRIKGQLKSWFYEEYRQITKRSTRS